MRDQPDHCIGLFVWAHTTPLINDGSGTRHVQIQVRHKSASEAYKEAHELAALLDSGMDEDEIYLTETRWCIARPRSLPRKYAASGTRTIYYFDVSLWGENTP